jgi:hypothetical protein
MSEARGQSLISEEKARSVLPRALRNAPPEIARQWCNARSRQYSMLRVVCLVFGAAFLFIGILRLHSAFTVHVVDVMLLLIIIAMAYYAFSGLTRARDRCEACAELFSSDEDIQT